MAAASRLNVRSQHLALSFLGGFPPDSKDSQYSQTPLLHCLMMTCCHQLLEYSAWNIKVTMTWSSIFPTENQHLCTHSTPQFTIREILTNSLIPNQYGKKILMFSPLHSFISFSFIIFKCCYNSVSAPRDFESVLKKALGNITPSSDLHNFVFHCMTKNILSASKIPSTDKNERSFNISKRKLK